MTPLQLGPEDRSQLYQLLDDTDDAALWCRSRALLWLAAGQSPTHVADLLNLSRQTVYNWLDRFQARAHLALPDRLLDAPRSGRPATALGIIDPLLDAVIDDDPRDFGYRCTTWTAALLRRYLAEVHHLEVSRRSVSRALARLRIRWKRPRHRLGLRPDTWRQSKGGSSAGCKAGCGRSC
jgi:transposase